VILAGMAVLSRGAAAAPPAYDFLAYPPYRNSVPTPQSILGYRPGDRNSTYRDQERVFLAIAAAAKDRVRLITYGESVEGRPLRLALVSTPENLRNLDTIRKNIGMLADPRTLPSQAAADSLLKETPCISWVNHCIHGDETASFETAMWTLYTLASSDSPTVQNILRHSVVVLNPVYNPDGHERYVVSNNSIAIGAADREAFEHEEAWVDSGRFNHYRFDLNRDKLAQSQPETRQETAAFLTWHPQVYVDEHGQPETYFFPPNAEPTNRNVDRVRLEKWTSVFGKANAATFDKHAWAYVNRETFDFYYPGYLDSFSTLSGAIGMTYETDGGGPLARYRQDGTVSTLSDATAHHFESAMSTLNAAASHREDLLKDYLAYKRSELAPVPGDSARRILILPGADPGRAAELAGLLTRVGVEVSEAKAAFSCSGAQPYVKAAGKKDAPQKSEFPAGTLVIDLEQPQGNIARAFLEADTDMEPSFVAEQRARLARNQKRNENEEHEDYGFYDVTGWALPLAYGLESYWTGDTTPVAGQKVELDAAGNARLKSQTGGVHGGPAHVAYLFKFDRDGAAYLALQLQAQGYRLMTATRPIRANGADWPRGTLIARVDRNPATLHKTISELAAKLGVEVTAIDSGYGDQSPVDIGSDSVKTLPRPSIAVATGDPVSTTGYGEVWYLLERHAGISFTPIRAGRIGSAQLSRYNVIVLPPGYGYESAIGKAGIDALKEWVRGGGVLIGLEGGGTWLTGKDVGIGTSATVGEGATPEKKPADLAGSVFRAHVDPTHFLGYGYESGELAVPLSGDTMLTASKQGANAVTFEASPLLLSGFEWPGNTEEMLAHTQYVVDEPMGRGHAVIYLGDPLLRDVWPGLRRLFLSSVLFGPGRPPLVEDRGQ
jgi:hypothetical protein